MSSTRVLALMLPHKLTGSSLDSWFASSLGDKTYIFVLLFELCHHTSLQHTPRYPSNASFQTVLALMEARARLIVHVVCALAWSASVCRGVFFVGEHSIDSDIMSHVCVWRVRTKLTQFRTFGCVSCVHVVVKLERMDIELGARHM